MLRAYLAYDHAYPEDYAFQEVAGGVLRERVRTSAAAVTRIDAAWLQQLDALADADDPRETILHTLALEARCDLAAAAATAGGVEAGAADLRTAFSRWRRHPESRH